MQTQELYLPMLIPLWGIFIGIALVIIGYVDKKSIFTLSGWGTLALTGFVALYFNLTKDYQTLYPDGSSLGETAAFLRATSWLNVCGSTLSIAALTMYRLKSKRYTLLVVLTILFFAMLFFQYYGLMKKPQ